jgi:CheY-like chemotaxis protein
MGTTRTFLLVEDDPNDVFMVEREFKRAPHLRLTHVPDATEAIRYLTGEGKYADRYNHPLPAVILLDLKMPGLSGFDFLQWLHSESPGDQRLIPVVVMSSSGLPEDIKQAYSLGVNSYMTKPVDWETFKDRIKTLGIYWSEHAEVPTVSSS